MHEEKRRGKEVSRSGGSFHLSPRMRFARSFRLAAERESRLRAGSPGPFDAIGTGAAGLLLKNGGVSVRASSDGLGIALLLG